MHVVRPAGGGGGGHAALWHRVEALLQQQLEGDVLRRGRGGGSSCVRSSGIRWLRRRKGGYLKLRPTATDASREGRAAVPPATVGAAAAAARVQMAATASTNGADGGGRRQVQPVDRRMCGG